MKKITLLCSLIIVATTLTAQIPSFKLAQRTGPYNTVYTNATVFVNDMKLDPYGHLYTLGRFDGTVDFDPGTAADLQSGSNIGYLTKTDTGGQHLWTKSLFKADFQRIEVDHDGNIYLTGTYSSTVDIDPGPGTHMISPNPGSGNIFLCKLDSAGNFVWGFGVTGGSGNGVGNSLYVDAQGNVFVTGFISGWVDMDPGPGVSSFYCQYDDAFVLKFDNNGNYLWSKKIGGFAYDHGRDITGDAAGNIYVTGAFQDVVDFDPGAGTFSMTAPGNYKNGFLLKLDNNGNFIWAKNFGGTNEDWVENVTIDKNNNPVISGYFNSSMDCDPGSATYTLTPSYGGDFFAVKLTDAGNFMWAKKFGKAGTTYDFFTRPLRHTIDTMGNLYFTGDFTDTSDFDPGPGVFELTAKWIPATFTYDNGSFILLLDSSGSFKWATQYGHGGQNNRGTAIQVDRSENIYNTGTFNDTVDFDPGTGITLLSNPPMQSGGYGMAAYLVKFGQCFTSYKDINASDCRSYTLNGQTYSQTGTYTQTYMNVGGCDSLVTLHLTINHADTVVTLNGNTLVAHASGASYTWIDCGTGMPVPGATQQQFSPTQNGSYALAVTQSGCTDTSACRSFVINGIEDVNATAITFVPNPVTRTLHIKGSRLSSARLYNMEGRLVLSQSLNESGDEVIDLSSQAAGTYLLQVTDREGKVFTRKITRQ